MKARDVLTELDRLKLIDRIQARYFEDWKANPDAWHKIHAKLSVLDDVRAELRQIANDESGVDNG